MIYYWESENKHGQVRAKNDKEGIRLSFKKARDEMLVIYKQSDTPDGTPFIIVWEK